MRVDARSVLVYSHFSDKRGPCYLCNTLETTHFSGDGSRFLYPCWGVRAASGAEDAQKD